MLPKDVILDDVQCLTEDAISSQPVADIFLGEHNATKVALKRIRGYVMFSDVKKPILKKVSHFRWLPCFSSLYHDLADHLPGIYDLEVTPS